MVSLYTVCLVVDDMAFTGIIISVLIMLNSSGILVVMMVFIVPASGELILAL